MSTPKDEHQKDLFVERMGELAGRCVLKLSRAPDDYTDA
jgi:hypothetical protein